MQHLDYAYAVSLVRTFMDDPTLVLTIRGRKYTPQFHFRVNGHALTVESVQTEIDAGYEGQHQVVLVEAKNTHAQNVIIRQLFYPYRQWSSITKKPVHPVFFERKGKEYHFWHFTFADSEDYASITLINAKRLSIVEGK